MGNSSQKVKSKFNTWYYSSKNGTAKIGSHMYCPTCNRHFSPNTTYNTLNNHLDSCLAAQGHTGNNNVSASLSQINSVADADTSIQNEKFVWVKKIEGEEQAKWEKRPSQIILEDQYLEDMQTDIVKDLNFEDKAKWFKFQYEKTRIPWTLGADYLKVSEHNLLKTVQNGIRKVNLHKEVKIVFEEEKNVNDAGGLLREFTHLFCLEAFSADKGLFTRTETQETIYQINPKLPDTKQNLEMFKIVGQVIGKAIFEQITISAQLDRFLLRLILQSDFTLEDLASVDRQLYNSLKYIRENSITDSEDFEEYFTIYSPVNGKIVELTENGSNLRINDDNKEQFIALKLDFIGRKCFEEKLDAFLAGLYQVISPDLFQVFTVEELEMILNGLPFIDISDWENHTIYKGSYYKNHQIVKWFWEVMKELNQEQLAKFFHFCTGSLRPPVEGFRVLQSNRGEFQKFTIESSKYVKDKSCITAHTCFNRLEIPMFLKKEALKENIYNILHIDFTGMFGIE